MKITCKRHIKNLLCYMLFSMVSGVALKAELGNVTTSPACDSSQNVIVAENGTVTFSIISGLDTITSSSGTFANTGGAFDGSFSTVKTVTFGASALGKSSTCTITLTTTGSHGETCSTSKKITFNVIVPKILSTTSATSPADQTRTNLGVGEDVSCSTQPTLPTGCAATWSVNNAGTIDPDTGDYTAGNVGEQEIVTLKLASVTLATLSFSVKTPSAVHYSDVNKLHWSGYPNVGFTGYWVMDPSDMAAVSFDNIEIGEENADAVCTGYFLNSGLNGQPHETSETFVLLDAANTATVLDNVRSGGLPDASYSSGGTENVDITMDYQVNGTTYSNCASETHHATCDSAGTCTITKDSTSETAALP